LDVIAIKKNPEQDMRSGLLQVVPQLVGFFDLGGVGVGGWGAAQVGLLFAL
jgi:hypothetical protein